MYPPGPGIGRKLNDHCVIDGRVIPQNRKHDPIHLLHAEAPGRMEKSRLFCPRKAHWWEQGEEIQLCVHPVFGRAQELRGSEVRGAGGQGDAGEEVQDVFQEWGGRPEDQRAADDSSFELTLKDHLF